MFRVCDAVSCSSYLKAYLKEGDDVVVQLVKQHHVILAYDGGPCWKQ